MDFRIDTTRGLSEFQDVVVICAAVSETVDEPRTGVEDENNRLVVGKNRIEGVIGKRSRRMVTAASVSSVSASPVPDTYTFGAMLGGGDYGQPLWCGMVSGDDARR